MKTANHVFEISQPSHTAEAPAGKVKSGRVNYFIAAVLLVVSYLVIIAITASPEASAASSGFNFAALWLGGGLTTLALLTWAAKR